MNTGAMLYLGGIWISRVRERIREGTMREFEGVKQHRFVDNFTHYGVLPKGSDHVKRGKKVADRAFISEG